MKKVFYLCLIAAATLLTSACQKDDEPVDPCDKINCFNDGNCVEGVCECPPAYTGPNCKRQVTPTRIRITGVKVTKFPDKNSGGAAWDANDDPDLFFSLAYQNSIFYIHPEVIANAATDQSHAFTIDAELDLENPTDFYSILLFDSDDSNSSEIISGVQFLPYSGTDNFPDTLTVGPPGIFTIELTLEYFYP